MGVLLLTWTWMHSLLALDKGDGIPQEGWSTWAAPAWETRGKTEWVKSAVWGGSKTDDSQPPVLILYSSNQMPCSCNSTRSCSKIHTFLQENFKNHCYWRTRETLHIMYEHKLSLVLNMEQLVSLSWPSSFFLNKHVWLQLTMKEPYCGMSQPRGCAIEPTAPGDRG